MSDRTERHLESFNMCWCCGKQRENDTCVNPDCDLLEN